MVTSESRRTRRTRRWLAVCVEAMETRVLLSGDPNVSLTLEFADAKSLAQAVPHETPSAKPGDIVAGGPFATPQAGPAQGAAAPFTPAEIEQFYGINSISFNGVSGTGAGQTIAVIDAYNNPELVSSTNPNFNRSELHEFDVEFGIPDPPSFSVIPEAGDFGLPTGYDSGWAIESALDVEWAHALAPMANIILVDCDSNNENDLINNGVAAARAAGATVISMSFIGPEDPSDTSTNSVFSTASPSPNVTYLASAGDQGVASTGYPAFSPYVVSVGGTSITTSDSSADYGSEVVWNDSLGATGGGISQYEPLPTYQDGETLSGSNRGVPDVSFDADPYTGVYVLDTSQSNGGGWYEVGGTSLSSPAWAALIAIADQGSVLTGQSAMNGYSTTLPRLYSLPSSDFHDVTSGNNSYSGSTGFSAGVGYDLASGLGTPVANTLVPDLAGVATITGRVFVDDSSNGVYGGNDTPLAGQTVYLDLGDTGVQQSNDPTTVTNSSGGYIFTNEPAGGVVRLANPNIPGYVATTTSDAITYGTTDTINLTYFPVTYSGNANYTLQTDATGAIDQIAVNGTVEYSVPSSFLSTLSFNLTGAGDSLTVDGTSGNPLPAEGVTLTGAGSNQLIVIGTASGNDAFNVSSSSISFGGIPINFSNVSTLSLNPGAGTDALNVSSGSVTVTPRASGSGILLRNFTSLAVAGGASALFATAPLHSNRTLVETTSLSVVGQLDLGGNDMIVHNGNLASITSLVATGYANGNWNGQGIASAAAHNDTSHLTALGAISNTNGGGTFYGGAGQSLFDGQTPAATDILIKYTYYGDANLDGKIDATDYSRIDNGYLMQLTGWANGDFNYDGLVDGSDYTLIDNAFNMQSTAL